MEIAIKTDEPGSVTKPFHCTICPKSVVQEVSLKEHILNKHVEDKQFQCTECFETNQLVKSFGTRRILTTHIRRTHGPPRFKCQVCFKTFNDSSNLAMHKRTHSTTNRNRQTCDLCSKTFCYKFALQVHLFRTHKQKREGVNYLKCEMCSLEFLHKSDLEHHVVRQHVVDKAFECHVCSKKFIDQETLDKHMKRHDKQNEYFCDVCSQGFRQKKSLVKHLGVKHNHFFYCDKKCLRSFKNKLHFDEHINDSKQELKCSVCMELINSECSLRIHTDSHLKEIKAEANDNEIQNHVSPLDADTTFTPKSTQVPNSEKFHCELCSKTFDREAYFRAHRREVHPNAEWKCNFGDCSKTYKVHSQFRRHQMIHAETKEFACNICGKSFYRPDNLKLHEQVHLKEKKYKCEICPKSFTGSSNLQSHVANNHGGPKPFKCPVVNCGTLWANNSQLNVHLISHQTDRSFKCELCAKFKAFKTLGKLKFHQRQVHLETKKTKTSSSWNKKLSEQAVFTCSSSSCSFETVNEKDVALHYNQQHRLPKVMLLRNIFAPTTAMSKEPGIPKLEMPSMIRKKFKCDICHELFKYKETFSEHQLVHSNAISFKCPVCSKSFKFKKNVKRHVKKFHQEKALGIRTESDFS